MLNTPATRKPSAYRAAATSGKSVDGIDQEHFLSADGNHPVRASIAGLLAGRSPATVAWLIIPIIVFALDAVHPGWLQSHVSQEVFELQPASTHFDAPTAIAVIALCFWVLATQLHGSPGAPFRRYLAAFGVAMFDSYRPLENFREVPTQASAGLCVTTSKPDTGCGVLFAAVAVAEPKDVPPTIDPVLSNYRKPAKSQSGNLNSLWHVLPPRALYAFCAIALLMSMPACTSMHTLPPASGIIHLPDDCKKLPGQIALPTPKAGDDAKSQNADHRAGMKKLNGRIAKKDQCIERQNARYAGEPVK